MSIYYNPRRKRNVFFPEINGPGKEPFTVSRSKIDLFVQCQRCFYLDLRHGLGRPPGFPMTLNNAVDELLKKEFDIHRKKQSKHPLIEKYGVDAVPLLHERMDEWRDALRRGISTLHKESGFFVRGGIDDVWVNKDGEYIIVDYKATAKSETPTLDEEWKNQYKRQMEIYQWLFKEAGFNVSNRGYFVYVNGQTDKEALDGKLEFEVTLLPYDGDSSWVPSVLNDMRDCLLSPKLPSASADCDFCAYSKERASVALEFSKESKTKIKKIEVTKNPENDSLFQ